MIWHAGRSTTLTLLLKPFPQLTHLKLGAYYSRLAVEAREE
ncbi:MAG: hypothetical protein JWN74_3592 [Acidobacteriaceae bacterium]|nr:hypothetical protein [Acidobacteriaceae bacterium]